MDKAVQQELVIERVDTAGSQQSMHQQHSPPYAAATHPGKQLTFHPASSEVLDPHILLIFEVFLDALGKLVMNSTFKWHIFPLPHFIQYLL